MGNQNLYSLRNLCKYIDRDLAILMYKTMILPVLEYSGLVLDGAPDTLVAEIQMIQNHCLRACLKIWDPRTIRVVDLHVSCTSKMLSTRRNESLLCRMYRMSRIPDNVVAPVRVLRCNDKIKIRTQRPKGELYRKSPKYRGMLAWNKLQGNVQRLEPFGKFVSDLKK